MMRTDQNARTNRTHTEYRYFSMACGDRSTGMRALHESSSGHNAGLAVRATFGRRQPISSWGRSRKSGMWHRPGSTTIGYAFGARPCGAQKGAPPSRGASSTFLEAKRTRSPTSGMGHLPL